MGVGEHVEVQRPMDFRERGKTFVVHIDTNKKNMTKNCSSNFNHFLTTLAQIVPLPSFPSFGEATSNAGVAGTRICVLAKQIRGVVTVHAPSFLVVGISMNILENVQLLVT